MSEEGGHTGTFTGEGGLEIEIAVTLCDSNIKHIHFFPCIKDIRRRARRSEIINAKSATTTAMTQTTGFRATTYSPAGADVSGERPTDPLIPMPSATLTIVDSSAYYPFVAATQKIVFPGNWTLLGPNCVRPADRDGDVWCNPTEECTLSLCECHLFSRAKDASPQDAESWRHEAGEAGTGQVKVRKDSDRVYHCFCVY